MKNDCVEAGAKWCENTYTTPDGNTGKYYYCSDTCPVCSEQTPWECQSKTSCSDAAGFNWCEAKYLAPEGSTESFFFCNGKEACPVCSKETPWSCVTESECTSSQGKWCKEDITYNGKNLVYNYCSDICFSEIKEEGSSVAATGFLLKK